jgi:class III poly(R)-hydroxyalkanoic acid synthase PhaE subunit
MADADTTESAWISAWITQQRAVLAGLADAKRATSAEAVRDLGDKWLEVGQMYLNGLQQHGAGQTNGANGAAPQFGLGDELFHTWRAAWAGAAAQGEASQRMADVFGKLPFVGLAREQAEGWRELAIAQSECQRLEEQLREVFARVQSDALELLEQRVRERERNGAPLKSYRDLYDLWVECGEHVYSSVAHSDSYARLQAELGNASMRLRARQQKLIEQGLKQFDLPTRSELNSVHRQLRDLRETLAALETRLEPQAESAVATERAPKPKTANSKAKTKSPQRKSSVRASRKPRSTR